jgi:hypothetical protein
LGFSTTPCSGWEPAIQLNGNSDVLGGWLSPLMVSVRRVMKIKHSLLAAVMVLAALLVYSHRERRKLQEAFDYQTRSIAAMGAAQASVDLSRSSASYFLLGLMEQAYVEAFEARFREYSVTPIGVGCKVTQAQHLYSDEYNRVIREFLVKRYGKDLIKDFDVSYWSNPAR